MRKLACEELSVLIPTYNYVCKDLVMALQKQAEVIQQIHDNGFRYEIIVADDGSTDRQTVEANMQIHHLDNCTYVICENNKGRAGIRNYLAQISHYSYLLYLDSDMHLPDEEFIRRYIFHDVSPVNDGGVVIESDGTSHASCLRYLYEKAAESKFTAVNRNKRPYKNFHTANFLIEREVMLNHPFDERFKSYGYEDVLFGKSLEAYRIPISHIDNPALFDVFEDNASFLAKTEESLRTLFHFQNELRGYSSLLDAVEKLRRWHLIAVVKIYHRLLGGYERKNLVGNAPSLTLFKLYKLGCFLSQ